MTTDAINNLANVTSRSSQEISDSINELADVFSYNHAENMWELQQQTNVLKDIRNELQGIRVHWDDNRANEWLEKGSESLKRGMVKESLNCLKKALEYNPLDYRIYVTSGHVYLRMDDLRNALNMFEYALKNAPTKYYESYSLLLMGRIYYCLGDLKTAVDKSKQAKELSPNYPEAHYQYSTYVAQSLSNKLLR
ncbi:MAG: hypothetical protein L6282_17435 [Candidatus Methanoperedenaceae archaeon]|nr:hypothetical protein [Candidatus Methanoperedenaceae archaeon]